MRTFTCVPYSYMPPHCISNLSKLVHEIKRVTNVYMSTGSQYPIHLKHDRRYIASDTKDKLINKKIEPDKISSANGTKEEVKGKPEHISLRGREYLFLSTEKRPAACNKS